MRVGHVKVLSSSIYAGLTCNCTEKSFEMVFEIVGVCTKANEVLLKII